MPSESRNKSGRKRVLLAMDLAQTPERRAGIARYALEARWIVDSRLAAFLVQGHEQEYMASSRIDGVLSMMTRHVPALHQLVSKLKVPVVDLWHDYPEMKCPR